MLFIISYLVSILCSFRQQSVAAFGGDGAPPFYNTISREIINNAYNSRFVACSREAKEMIKNNAKQYFLCEIEKRKGE